MLLLWYNCEGPNESIDVVQVPEEVSYRNSGVK